MTERSSLIETNAGSTVCAVRFLENGEYLVGGDKDAVRVWRVQDGKQMGTMKATYVQCLAVSQDGRWIAAGTYWGWLFVWDATTYEQAFKDRVDVHSLNGVDFSPNSDRLVSGSRNGTTTVWDTITGRQVQTLSQEEPVRAAKYSPQGDRIATATPNSVRVWDSDDGHLLVDIATEVTPGFNNGLFWFSGNLSVVSDTRIDQFDASTGSVVSKWPVPHTHSSSHVALARHGEFIAHSTNRTVSFWDTSTHTQLGLIQHPQNICSIAFSSDNAFLAIGGEGGKITIKHLSRIIDPGIQINDASLDLWKQDQLENAEALMTTAISESQDPSPHVLASRALVRARLRQWDAALVDAEKAINTRPSVIGYIAKCVAHVGKGERQMGYRACDIAFQHCHPSYVGFLLLIKAIIVFMAGEHLDAISRVDDLIVTVPFNSICYTIQAYMHLLLGNSHMDNKNYKGAVQSFECARGQVRYHRDQPLLAVSLISGWKFDGLDITIQQRLCDALYAVGRTKDASECLLELVNTFHEAVYTSEPINKWVSDFTRRFLTPENDSYTDVDVTRQGNPRALHVTPTPLLRTWAKLELTRGSWKDVLLSAAGFTLSREAIYQVLCERLGTTEDIEDAVGCFREMTSELGGEINHLEWALDFRQRFVKKLEYLGDTAASVHRHDEAASYYTIALSLNPPSPQCILIKRSKACMAIGTWKQALDDANQAITHEPSSPWAYEMKHAALHKAEDYDKAIDAFEVMLSKMEESPDLDVRQRCDQYVHPSTTRATIRRIVQQTTSHSPRVLINTINGRLYNRAEQASAFESQPIFKELVSSVTTRTTRINYARIKHEVLEYFRYVTLSHKWEDNEPLFRQVVHVAVYDLEESLTHDKLQTFCKIVRNAGFNWAWSDTCCIDKSDHVVLQEALVAMFKWYQGSVMTIVYLRDVRSTSQRGALAKSIWNTRAWTLQEYIAAKVIRFYTGDWTLYRDLKLPNHKESPEVISEMAQASGVSAQQLMTLRPGLSSIREKLCLASKRRTTLVEDAAYSLLGIFSATGIHAIYGEGEASLGRLLAHVLADSGNISILAWSGESGSFNSCLPANIAVFKRPVTSHLPLPIPDAEIERVIATPHFSSFDLDVALKLFDRLNALPPPWFAASRMKLPCIAFQLPPLSQCRRTRLGRIYHVDTVAFGRVEIKTRHDLSQKSLYLIHPWLDTLLEREDKNYIILDRAVSLSSPNADDDEISGEEIDDVDDSSSLTELELPPIPPPVHIVPMDRKARARRLVARLGQSFGALLVTLLSSGGRAVDYKRVAPDSMITVQFQENVSLAEILDNVQTLDVL